MKILILLIIPFLLFTNCKKKTDIQVKVYNPRLDEFVPKATVILFENNFSFLSTGRKDIISAITDNNGVAYFDNVKLKKSGKHEYHVTLKDAWGISNSNVYNTESYEGSLNKGSSSIITLYDTEPDATFSVKYNSLLNPSQPNDSINITIKSIALSLTKHSYTYVIGGDIILKKSFIYDLANLPYPTTFSSNSINYKASRLVITIKKNKMGISSTSVDTVKIYPDRVNTININW